MREIPLTRGMVAWVDDEDYPALAAHKWCVLANRSRGHVRHYAVRSAPGKLIYMHRVILGVPAAVRVDHIEHREGVVDNRRSNLRPVTPTQNLANARKQPGASSMFKGVTRAGRKWLAQITLRGRCVSLGRFGNEEDAARAYDAAAHDAFGEYALLNFANKEGT